MMKLVRKDIIIDVESFGQINNEIFICNQIGQLQIGSSIVAIDVEPHSIGQVNDFLFFYDQKGEFQVCKSGSILPLPFSIEPFQNTVSKVIGYSNRTRKGRGVYEKDIIVASIVDFSIREVLVQGTTSTVLYVDDNYLLLQKSSCISILGISNEQCIVIEEIDFCDLGGSTKKVVGVIGHIVYLALDADQIVSLNLQAGSFMKIWEGKDGLNSLYLKSDFLPTYQNFQIDKSLSEIYSLYEQSYFRLDVHQRTVKYTDLAQNLERWSINRLRWSLGYAESDEYVFTIAELDQDVCNRDFIPQAIIALSKTRHEIEESYQFKSEGIYSDVPLLIGNQIFQKTNQNNLYIFDLD